MSKLKNQWQKLPNRLYSLFLIPTAIFSENLNQKINEQGEAFRQPAGFGEVTFGQVVARVIMVFLAILGMIFIGLIVYAGFEWMTARGNEEKIRKAQDTLKHAIWGLIITLSAYSIAYFILAYLVTGGATTTGIP